MVMTDDGVVADGHRWLEVVMGWLWVVMGWLGIVMEWFLVGMGGY